MVGSVLVERMRAEGDFKKIEPVFFSTSQPGAAGPDLGGGARPVLDAKSVAALLWVRTWGDHQSSGKPRSTKLR